MPIKFGEAGFSYDDESIVKRHIKIGEVETLRTEDWEIIPDDRQTRIETIGGWVVQDFGYVESGESYSCSVTLPAAAANTVQEYWRKRELVTIRDIAGVEIENVRVVIKKYGYVRRFEKMYKWLKLELWRMEETKNGEASSTLHE